MECIQEVSRPGDRRQRLSRQLSKRQRVFKRFNSIVDKVKAKNRNQNKEGTFSEDQYKITIEELRTQLDESVAMVDGLKFEVKHVRSYYANRIPKVETENEKLRQQIEAITTENDELANDLYDMVEENEEMIDSLEKVERDLLNSTTSVQRVSKENESLSLEVELFRASVNPNNSITHWFSRKPQGSVNSLSPEDREDAELNAKIVQIQLKKDLNQCLLEVEQMRQENLKLSEERDSWMEKFGVVSEEVHEMRIQGRNGKSIDMKSFAYRRISGRRESANVVRVKSRLSKRLSVNISMISAMREEVEKDE